MKDTDRTVQIGDIIRIDRVFAETDMTRDGIDHQAKVMEGKTGVVEHIDSHGTLHGSWGGLGVIPEKDSYTIIKRKNNE